MVKSLFMILLIVLFAALVDMVFYGLSGSGWHGNFCRICMWGIGLEIWA